MYNFFLFCAIAVFFHFIEKSNAMEEGKCVDCSQHQIDSGVSNPKRRQHQPINDEELLATKEEKFSFKPGLVQSYRVELAAHRKVNRTVEPHTKQTQIKQYLGKISGILYKDTIKDIPSQEIRGFFVEVLQQKIEDEVVVLKDTQLKVYLPYVVVIKKNLCTDSSVRNSNGTLLENLDVSLSKLIEFDEFATAVWKMINPITRHEESYFVIKSRPIQSILTEKDI